MRLLFAGTPSVALPALTALANSPHEVVAVLTRPDARSGRGRQLTPSPVALWAQENGVEVLRPGHPRDPEFQTRLAALAPDCCPVVAYGALLPASVLSVPKFGWVNLHFSLLPQWRGAAPVQHALLRGDEITGATTFQIVPELDAGPTFGIMTERVLPQDTAGSLLGRLAEGGAELLLATMDGLENEAVEARPQPTDGITVAPKITVDDARVRWEEPASFVDRRIRACTPAPGAWTLWGEERLKLGPVTAAPVQAPALAPVLAPGELLVSKHDVVVGTRTAALRLGLVRPHGRKEMPAADWARGARVESGARLG